MEEILFLTTKISFRVQVWDAVSAAAITFTNDDYDDVAYVVENNLLVISVNDELKRVPNVEVLNEAKIKSCLLPTGDEGKAGITLENGTEFSCDLLVSVSFLI